MVFKSTLFITHPPIDKEEDDDEEVDFFTYFTYDFPPLNPHRGSFNLRVHLFIAIIQ